MLCTIQAGKVLRVAVTEGVKGATADFVRFHCPLVAPAGAIPPATQKHKQLITTKMNPETYSE